MVVFGEGGDQDIFFLSILYLFLENILYILLHSFATLFLALP